ncbi:MAG TPA: hypothetical protein VIP11_25115 [Gemmatimonadaceae bacterium]
MKERNETQTAYLIDSAELARMLGVAPNQPALMRMAGTGPVFRRLSARCIRYHIDDVQRWLDERRATSTSAASAA